MPNDLRYADEDINQVRSWLRSHGLTCDDKRGWISDDFHLIGAIFYHNHKFEGVICDDPR